jgi:outer membrane lipoprotein-sorting protein
MQMSDALGQTTHLVLRDVQLNPALKANEFMIDESKYALDAW